MTSRQIVVAVVIFMTRTNETDFRQKLGGPKLNKHRMLVTGIGVTKPTRLPPLAWLTRTRSTLSTPFLHGADQVRGFLEDS